MTQYATIQEVNTSIMFSNFSNTQLDSIISAVKYARTQLAQDTKRELRVGSTVKFYSTKRGITVTGTVDKIAIKYVTVRETPQTTGRLVHNLWKVPANMLEAA